MTLGKGEELVDVVDVSPEVEALEVWFPAAVTVTVLVTVGVVVFAAIGEGALAGTSRDLAVEAIPAIIETRPRVSPTLSKFLRVTFCPLGSVACGSASFFCSSSLGVVMARLSLGSRRTSERRRLSA
jgi:hypothetical protein